MPTATWALFVAPLLAAAMAGGQDDWRLVDGVALQAGDEVVTLSEFQEFVRSKTQDAPISTPQELQVQIQRALAASEILRLESQAGQDLGLDPAQIDRIVRDELQADRRDRGVNAYADELDENGLRFDDVVDGRTANLYRIFWRQKSLGLAAAGERPIHDRYIRPGVLRASYRFQKDELAEPALVRLQLLDVPVAALGSEEQARPFVEALRARLLDGEDFSELVIQYGGNLRDTEGRTELIEVRRLIDPRLREFAASAAPEALSEVQPIVREGKTVGFRIAKLLEREEGAPPPPFTAPELQTRLRRALLSSWEQAMLERARAGLEEHAFLWRHPSFRSPGPSEPLVGPPAP